MMISPQRFLSQGALDLVIKRTLEESQRYVSVGDSHSCQGSFLFSQFVFPEWPADVSYPLLFVVFGVSGLLCCCAGIPHWKHIKHQTIQELTLK